MHKRKALWYDKTSRQQNKLNNSNLIENLFCILLGVEYTQEVFVLTY